MFKSKLQEYCQSKKWNLPEYSTTREGLDHCPQFKATVTVNGSTFTTPNPSKSSKEAHNLVANIAYQHLTGSPSANNALQVSPTSVDAQQPKMNEPLQAATVSDVNFSSRDDKKFKDMAHLYKNQLQIYAQKKNINLPVYISEREGPPHACRFKSKVMLEEKTYESFEFFSTIKDAENAAAKAALMSVSSDETEEEDPGFFKNLLQELAQKEYSCLPAYVTTRSGPSHYPIFSSTVEINEESFTGQEAKTKKLAEMNAAKVAYIAMKERKGKPNFKPDSLSYHVNDAPPKSQFVPIADLSDKHILAPDPIFFLLSPQLDLPLLSLFPLRPCRRPIHLAGALSSQLSVYLSIPPRIHSPLSSLFLSFIYPRTTTNAAANSNHASINWPTPPSLPSSI